MLEDDVLRFRWIADPQISPDGRSIAFTLVRIDAAEDEYRTDLWLASVPAPGGETLPPRPLTYDGRSGQPRWSPDGARLAFVRRSEHGKPGQLHVLPLAGGEGRAVTSLVKGAHSPAWSPDGTRLAFVSGHDPEKDTADAKPPKHEPARVVTGPEFRWNNEGFTDFDHLDHLWVVAVDGGEPTRLTAGRRFKEDALAWSPDGRELRFITDRRETPWFDKPGEDSDLRSVSVTLASPTEGADTTLIADIAGPIGPYVEHADGRVLAVGGVRAEKPNTYEANHLLLFDGARPMTSPRVLTQGMDLHVGEGINSDQHPPRGGGSLPLGFALGGKAAVFVHARRGAAHLSLCDLASGKVEDLTPKDREVIAGTISGDGKRVALTLGSVRTPGELCVYDLERRTLTPVFDANAEMLSSVALGDVEEIDYPSADGTRIQGWIMKPPGFDAKLKYPLLLQIHGGPHTAYGVGFFHEYRVQAAAGYVVLYTNPRGSTSYGQKFADCIQYQFPGVDHDDLMAGVDHVIAKGYIDTARMGVTGGSGGGLLTNWIIAKTHRFAAAITQRCVSDWAGMFYSCDFAMFQPFWFRGAPWEHPDDFAKHSPMNYLTDIQTPLMVIHSEEDWRTPIAQGEVMFRGLLYQKKPVVMVRFPGENHELSRSGMPSRRVQNQQHIRRWFDHFLMDKPAPEYGVASPVRK
jgi:dipeptidyl aminopeptidase/acylaminoacyl peptidase